MTLTQDWLAAIDGTNALAGTIEFSRHGLLQHADPADAARVMFEDADPVREFPSWPGKRNFEGKLWMLRRAGTFRSSRRTLVPDLAGPDGGPIGLPVRSFGRGKPWSDSRDQTTLVRSDTGLLRHPLHTETAPLT